MKKIIAVVLIGLFVGTAFPAPKNNVENTRYLALDIFPALPRHVFGAFQEQCQRLYDMLEDWWLGIYNALDENLPAVAESPYKNTVAHIRIGNELPEQEKQFLANRLPRVKQAIEQLLNTEITDDQVLKVAVVCSGGGYRAFISSIGWLAGMEQEGLLDTVTYISSLSGSCWGVGSWIASELSLQDFKATMIDELDDGLFKVNKQEAHYIAENLLTKYIYNQPITLVDYYGALLANRILSEYEHKRQRVHLSEQIQLIGDGSKPFPIYTAVRGDNNAAQQWYEFTPCEVGASWLGHYVPTWAFGRHFNNGVSIDYAPEQGLGYLFGIFGSGFSGTIGDMYQYLCDNIEWKLPHAILERILHRVSDKRVTAARIPNFTHGIEDSPIKSLQDLRMVDAGLQINLPYPPVSGLRSERACDVLIFLDASGLYNDAHYLQQCSEYAQQHDLSFPHADFTGAHNHLIRVYKDEQNSDAPVVIYIPLIKKQCAIDAYKDDPRFYEHMQWIEHFNVEHCLSGACSIFNFDYEAHEIKQLGMLTEFNMRVVADQIVEALAWAVAQKQ